MHRGARTGERRGGVKVLVGVGCLAVITRGMSAWEAWSTWWEKRSAASASRPALNMKAIVAPADSTAR
jgi:hypothetical protein